MSQTQTDEKLELGLPKKYKFILQDIGGNITKPGKSDMIKFLLKKVCNMETIDAMNASRNLDKNGMVVVGIYPKQIAQTMKNKADEILNQPQYKIFGISTKIEAE